MKKNISIEFEFYQNEKKSAIANLSLLSPPDNAEVDRIWSSVKNTINDRSTSMGRQCLENRLFIKNSKVNLNYFNSEED